MPLNDIYNEFKLQEAEWEVCASRQAPDFFTEAHLCSFLGSPLDGC
jgi:hypothetical protein